MSDAPVLVLVGRGHTALRQQLGHFGECHRRFVPHRAPGIRKPVGTEFQPQGGRQSREHAMSAAAG